jgi:hypothetical protein
MASPSRSATPIWYCFYQAVGRLDNAAAVHRPSEELRSVAFRSTQPATTAPLHSNIRKLLQDFTRFETFCVSHFDFIARAAHPQNLRPKWQPRRAMLRTP